jgi:hypothetical protein
VLYLDEDTSGDTFASLLGQGKLTVRKYENLLRKNKKIQDSTVIAACAKENWVLVTKDGRMETEWIDYIIAHKAKIILLTDDAGGPIHWTAALLAGQTKWERALLDNPNSPITIRLDRQGTICKLAGAQELTERRNKLLTASKSRAKKHHANKQRGAA